jgi:tetratricopeptide (TPR) repeat protein
MSRWIPGFLLAGLAIGLAPLAAQEQTTPQTNPQTSQPKPQLEERTPPKTSGKQAVPAEEDKSFLTEEHSFNPLQSQKSVDTGDFYFKKGKFQAAANRYLDATMWNDGNAGAWLKLAKADEKVRDLKAAKDAYSKYLAVAPDAKDAGEIRKKLEKLK